MSESGLGKPTDDSTDSSKDLSCIQCGKGYGSRQGLSYHYANSDCDGFTCPECGKSDITTERGLTRHKANEHGIKGSYIDSRITDREWYYQKYVVEGNTTREIAELVGCSRPQASAWKRKHSIESIGAYKSRGEGADNPTWVDNTVTIVCDYCGDERERVESNVTGEHVFCSWGCMNHWKSENWVGENNPLYQGGPQYYGQGWKQARSKALDRDSHTCQGCGTSENLNVHHIRRVRDFDDPTDAHYLENLTTLCDSCHMKWEGIPLKPDNR